MTIDEAIKALQTLRRPATALERDLALTVVAHQVARSLAIDGGGEFYDDVAYYSGEIAKGLVEHPEPQHLGTVSRRAPGAD